MNVRAVVWPLVAACLMAGLDLGVRLMVPAAKPWRARHWSAPQW